VTYQVPHPADVVSHAFTSVGAGGNNVYAGGFYMFGVAADDFNPAINVGTANAAYGAHVGFVADVSPGADTTITVAGTSITDAGVRTAADSEAVTFLNADAQGTYRETVKKWIGQITITKTAGSDRLCNYMFVAYWDNGNHDFTLSGFEATWFGGGTDGGADIKIYHHRAAGWTFAVAAPPTPPTPLYRMQTVYGAEHSTANNQPGKFKRADLSDRVVGNDGEGLIAEIIQTVGKPFEAGTIQWSVQTVHTAVPE